MRNLAIAGVAIALLTGSASSKVAESTYQSVKEVCLFSPTVPPADSSLAIRNMGTDYDFVREFKTGLAGKAPNASKGGASAMIATATLSLKGIYEPLWYPDSQGKIGEIDGASDFDFRANAGSADDSGTRFRVSGISSVGVETNGFVAGFDMKY
jgi:hypothetical protein